MFPLVGPSSILLGSSFGIRPLERNRCTFTGNLPNNDTMVALWSFFCFGVTNEIMIAEITQPTYASVPKYMYEIEYNSTNGESSTSVVFTGVVDANGWITSVALQLISSSIL